MTLDYEFLSFLCGLIFILIYKTIGNRIRLTVSWINYHLP